MYMSFDRLPKAEKIYLIETFGLPEREEQILKLAFVDRLSSSGIAAEMFVSQKSVGRLLHNAKKHMVEIAKQCYDISDDRTRKLIDILGWKVLDWPTLKNRRNSK